MSQLASRNSTRGPNRLPAFCRESIHYHFRRAAGVDWRAAGLRTNLDRRAHRNPVPNLVDLLVGDGDAAQRPVVEPVRRADPALAVGQAVDHDGSAGRDAQVRGNGFTLPAAALL